MQRGAQILFARGAEGVKESRSDSFMLNIGTPAQNRPRPDQTRPADPRPAITAPDAAWTIKRGTAAPCLQPTPSHVPRPPAKKARGAT